MTDKIGVAILAAGLGKRMGVEIAKPLIPLMGAKLVDYSIDAASSFASSANLEVQFGIVVGHQKEAVETHVKAKHTAHKTSFPVQKEQKGTADALRSYFDGCDWAKETKYTMVLCADTPLITSKELEELWSELKNKNLSAVAASFETKNPYGYGRIVRAEKGFAIIEEKDATDAQRKITEVNSGLYIFETELILNRLKNIDSNNNSGEFYLTDAFEPSGNVSPVCFSSEIPFLGVNSPVQLSTALHQLKLRTNEEHQARGVLILDRAHTYIEPSVSLDAGVTIYPNTFLHGNTEIKAGSLIEPGCILKDSKISSQVTIKAYSYLENAEVQSQCAVGPYARLRPGTKLGEQCKVGNFVEIKKADLDKKVSVSHLSYVGDAEIGENVNIGCGFITCNYDGESKHLTKIGKNSFIGSDTQMIAPVEVGESAFVASGSTINQDVPSQGFALSRARQVTKEKMASRFLKGKWAIEKKS